MNSTPFRDLATIMALIFLVMVVFMMPHLNPPALDANRDPPGNIAARMCWTEGDLDVDMWMDAPGEPRPVGYSNDNGLVWNLTWDDLGEMADLTSINCEHGFTRGIVPGEYTINAHCYRCAITPVHISLEVGVKLPNEVGKNKYKPLVVTELDIKAEGQERTAIRFTLNADGSIVEGSVHSVLKKLRIPAYSGGRGGQ